MKARRITPRPLMAFLVACSLVSAGCENPVLSSLNRGLLYGQWENPSYGYAMFPASRSIEFLLDSRIKYQEGVGIWNYYGFEIVDDWSAPDGHYFKFTTSYGYNHLARISSDGSTMDANQQQIGFPTTITGAGSYQYFRP